MVNKRFLTTEFSDKNIKKLRGKFMASWNCPYCGQIATRSAIDSSFSDYNILRKTKYGKVGFRSFLLLCPNDECGVVVVSAQLDVIDFKSTEWVAMRPLEAWKLGSLEA